MNSSNLNIVLAGETKIQARNLTERQVDRILDFLLYYLGPDKPSAGKEENWSSFVKQVSERPKEEIEELPATPEVEKKKELFVIPTSEKSEDPIVQTPSQFTHRLSYTKPTESLVHVEPGKTLIGEAAGDQLERIKSMLQKEQLPQDVEVVLNPKEGIRMKNTDKGMEFLYRCRYVCPKCSMRSQRFITPDTEFIYCHTPTCQTAIFVEPATANGFGTSAEHQKKGAYFLANNIWKPNRRQVREAGVRES